MKEILEKYYGMNKVYRNDLESLYIYKIIQEKLKKYKELDFTVGEEETLFCLVEYIYENCNIKVSQIIEQLLNVIKDEKLNLYYLDEMDLEELLYIVSDEIDEYEVISEFEYKGLKCKFERDGDKVILTYKSTKNDYNESTVKVFNNLEELLCLIIDLKMSAED